MSVLRYAQVVANKHRGNAPNTLYNTIKCVVRPRADESIYPPLSQSDFAKTSCFARASRLQSARV